MTILKTIIMGAVLGMLWSPPDSEPFISKPATQTAASAVTPRLYVAPEGALYLIWKEEQDSQSGSILFNRSPDRGQSWPQAPRRLDQEKPAKSRSSSPRVESDRQGHVYAAWWTKHRDGRKDVLLSTSKDFGVSFGPPIKLNADAGAFPPEVSADANGHVYVVWADERAEARSESQGRRPHGHRIYFNRSSDHGATWLPQDIKLSGDGGSKGRIMQAWPQIHSDAQGHVYVIWFDTRHGGGGVYFRASDDFARTWREEIRIKGDAGDVEGPMQMAANERGHIYVTWADNRDGEYGIYLVASTDHGKTWSQEIRLDVGKTKVARASLPTLAADTAGHVYVVWQDARHGGWDIYLNMSSDFGKTWHPAGVRLNTGAPGEAEARLPQIALNGQGTLAVTWQEDRGAEQQEGIYLTWSTDFGKVWLTPDIRVDDQKTGLAAVQPQLTLLQDGSAIIAWEVLRPSHTEIAVAVLPPGVQRTPTH